MRKLFFCAAEALGVIPKATSPLYTPLDLAALYAQPTDEARAKLVALLEGHRQYFGRFGDMNPKLLGFAEHTFGCFGRVYVSPCGRFALKVSMQNDDDAYGTFVNLCLKRQHNPFYPRVYCHLRHGKRNVVLMERLHELPMDPKANAFVKSTKERVRSRIPASNKSKRFGEGYAELVADLTTLVHTHRFKCDIKAHNVMLRRLPNGNEHYVVTDPVC